jgi:hypothetical protein
MKQATPAGLAQPDAELLFNELSNEAARPKRRIHFQTP